MVQGSRGQYSLGPGEVGCLVQQLDFIAFTNHSFREHGAIDTGRAFMRLHDGFHSAGTAGSDFQKTVEAQTPLGRIGQPDDIGPVAVFFASEDARWVTGQALLVSGGRR